MEKRHSKRARKKRLRAREGQLNAALALFLEHYDFSLALDAEDPTATPETERQFRLLLQLRWLVNDFLWVRLKLHPAWRKRQWFLELFDVDELRIENGSVTMRGDVVWWAQGKDAFGQWWPADHEPHPTASYKVKIRGELDGGFWVLEPMNVILKPAKTEKHNAGYQIEFGYGSTYLKATNMR